MLIHESCTCLTRSVSHCYDYLNAAVSELKMYGFLLICSNLALGFDSVMTCRVAMYDILY